MLFSGDSGESSNVLELKNGFVTSNFDSIADFNSLAWRMQAFNAFFGLEEFKNMDHKLNYGLSAADDG